MRGLAFLSLLVPGSCFFAWAAGCGQGFTEAADGGADRRSQDVATSEGGSDEFVPEGGPSDSPQGPDSAPEASPCPGAGSFMTDRKNCGGCGHACGLGEPCKSGMCPITTVASGLQNASGVALDSLGEVFVSELGLCTSGSCAAGQILKASAPGTPLATGLGSTADDVTGFPGLPVASFGTTVYWATSQTPGIVQQESAGSAATTKTITPGITASWVALAVDDKYVYVGESGGSIYYASTLAPGTWSYITNSKQRLAALVALSVGSTHYVYWANSTNAAMHAKSGSVRGAIASGSPISMPSWTASGLDAPTSVAVWPNGVDWIDQGAADIEQEPVTMGKVTVVEPSSAMSPPCRIVADSTSTLYWTVRDVASPSDGRVMTLPAGATTPIVLADQQLQPCSLAIYGSKVYWVNAGSHNGGNGSVMSTRR